MVRDLTHGVMIHYLEGFGVYDVHRAIGDVGDIDPFADAGQLLADLRGGRRGVDVCGLLGALVARRLLAAPVARFLAAIGALGR